MAVNDDGEFGRRQFLNSAGSVAAASVAASASLLGRDYTHDDRSWELSPGSILDVGDLRVGHFTDVRRPTGCTVILFDQGGAVASVDVRGSAPGTRETDLLNPVNTVQKVNAILLSGGSAFGLDAATGVMRYVEEKGQGYRLGPLVVPIVPAAILFDLNIGDAKIRPNADAGYAACQNASHQSIEQGNVGAGAGATVGKLFGLKCAMKSGIGTASLRVGGSGLIVGAIVAVNAVGDVSHYESGKLLAGARTQDGSRLRNSMREILEGSSQSAEERPGANTTIGVVTTNADLTKTELAKVARMAHDGLARTINPVHTAADGDTIFAAATGSMNVRSDISVIGSVAAEAVARAINNAVLAATGIPGYPACRDLPRV
ncbi:MAG: P1 family peptidase [Acidobacteriaceae bacterium]|nr:P1 family peptidase [Acidobacteriaceae bacterium]MBV9502092.1 P1 family peptidase [Acidobacteriaceae bacterium]